MTPEDRKLLSGLLERVKTLDSHKTHERFIYFINKCIEEAMKRGASSFAERFIDMRNGHRLSYQAFKQRRTMGGKLSATGHASISWAFFPGAAV